MAADEAFERVAQLRLGIPAVQLGRLQHGGGHHRRAPVGAQDGPGFAATVAAGEQVVFCASARPDVWSVRRYWCRSPGVRRRGSASGSSSAPGCSGSHRRAGCCRRLRGAGFPATAAPVRPSHPRRCGFIVVFATIDSILPNLGACEKLGAVHHAVIPVAASRSPQPGTRGV